MAFGYRCRRLLGTRHEHVVRARRRHVRMRDARAAAELRDSTQCECGGLRIERACQPVRIRAGRSDEVVGWGRSRLRFRKRRFGRRQLRFDSFYNRIARVLRVRRGRCLGWRRLDREARQPFAYARAQAFAEIGRLARFRQWHLGHCVSDGCGDRDGEAIGEHRHFTRSELRLGRKRCVSIEPVVIHGRAAQFD